MSQYKAIDNLFRDLDAFMRQAGELADRIPPSKERTLLTDALSRLKEVRPGADVKVIDSVDYLKQVCESQVVKHNELAERLARVREDIARAKAAPPPPVVAAAAAVSVPAFTVDSGLGSRLRDELLAHLGQPADGREPARPGKDIWEDWK